MFHALSSANKDSLEFHEEWAIKRGQYGASEGFEEVEFILDESKFRLSPQPVELVNFVDPTKTDSTIGKYPTDVYSKPKKVITQSITKNTLVKDTLKQQDTLMKRM